MTLSQKDITHWSKYLSRRQFATEQEARDFIFRRLEQSDHDHGSLFGVQGSEKNATFAAAMPVYKLKTCWKVGKSSLAYNRKPRWTWDSCTIRSTPHDELVQIAQANETADFTIKRKQLLPLRALGIQRSPAGDRYEGEARYIEQLARTIKQDEGWFECVVVGTYDMKEFWLIEGQHRARGTAWFLKMSTIPADVIWYDERTEESMKPAAFIALCEGAYNDPPGMTPNERPFSQSSGQGSAPPTHGWLTPGGRLRWYNAHSIGKEDILGDCSRSGDERMNQLGFARVVVGESSIWVCTDVLSRSARDAVVRFAIDHEYGAIHDRYSPPYKHVTIYEPPICEDAAIIDQQEKVEIREDAGIRIQRFTGDDEHYSDDEDAENSMGLDDSDVYAQAEEVFKACGLRVMRNRKLSFVALAADQKARFGEKVVGAVYSTFSNGHGDPDNGEPDEPFLDYTFDIAILPQYQGGLLGLQLIQAMLKEAKAEGGGDMPVRCRNWVINPVAAKLLTHLGFEMESKGMPDGRYSAHMVKWL